MKYEESAKRLRKAMKDKGLKQQELSDLSGVNKSNISHYVNGNHIPASQQAYMLSKVLDVTPEYLMCLEDTQKYAVVENSQLMQIISTLSDDDLKRLLAYAKKLKSSKNK